MSSWKTFGKYINGRKLEPFREVKACPPGQLSCWTYLFFFLFIFFLFIIIIFFFKRQIKDIAENQAKNIKVIFFFLLWIVDAYIEYCHSPKYYYRYILLVCLSFFHFFFSFEKIIFHIYLANPLWYLSNVIGKEPFTHKQTAKVQASLYIRALSP